MVKLRRLLITAYLWIAGLLAPAFFVMAIYGGLCIAGIEGKKAERVPISIPAGIVIDLGSENLEADIRKFSESHELDADFEYVRGRPDTAQTRPTTRTFIILQQTPDGLQAAISKPDFLLYAPGIA